MSLNRFYKVLAIFMLAILFIPGTIVSASEVGWPVTAEATATTDTVEDEAIPETTTSTVVSDATSETNVDTTSDAGLSAIDEDTTTLQDSAVFGEDYDLINRLDTNTASEANSNSELNEAAKIYSNYSDVVPVVTTDQMVEWILKKGNEIISILQIFAQPFAIIIFIVSCAICLIGSLTKGNMMGKGLIGMVASAILYAACLYAPTLVNSVSSFLAS